MKNILAFTALLAVTAAASANAASLSVTTFGTGASTAHSVYLDGENDNGNFDTVNIIATPNVGSSFANISATGNAGGLPRPAGDAFTYRNRVLDRDPLEGDGGKGWTVVGVVNTPEAFEFTGGPLGNTITTSNEPNGDLFLANFSMPTGGGSAVVSLFRLGAPVGSPLTIAFPVPEPATFAMAGLGLVGIVACSRRKA